MALYALLAGVNSYKNKELPQLFGPEKDMGRISSYLLNNFPGADTHVVSIAGKEATKEGIVNGFKNHLSQASANDQVLFYFSGHGALEQVYEAFRGIEKNNRFFETLVCYDSLAGTTTLADKEMRYLIGQLSVRCPNITVMLDCCHSGGGTRNAEMILKRLAKEVPSRQWDEFIFAGELTESAVRSASSLAEILKEGTHVQLAACESRQSAWEVRGSGIFTSNLLQVLQHVQGSISYLDLYSRVKFVIANRFDQVPNLYARADNRDQYLNRLFLGGNPAGGSSGNANVVFNSPTNSWILDKGAIHGIRHVSGAFDLELSTMAGQPPVTRARITGILPDRSLLELEDPRIAAGTYYTTIKGLYQKELAVFITGEDQEQAAIENIKAFYTANKALYEGEGIKIADDYSQADYVIVATGNAYYLVRPNESVKPAELKPLIGVISGYTEASAQQLLNACISIARWEFIRGLQNPDTAIASFPFDIAFQFTGTGEGKKDVRPDANGLVEYSYGSVSEDGIEKAVRRATVSLINRSSTPYYCAVVYLGIAFNIVTDLIAEEVVYVEKAEAPVSAETTDTDEMVNRVWLADGDVIDFYQEDFTREYNHPMETTWLLLIACTNKFEISGIQQEALPMPKKDQDRSGEAKGVSRPASREEALPAADWCTKLVRLQFRNPFYKEPESSGAPEPTKTSESNQPS